MLKHNKERLKDIRIFSSQYAAKNNQEREEFMKVLNQALMDKYGEDMDNFDAVPEPPISFTDKGLTDLLNAFWTKHNLEKIDEVDTFAAQHDKLDTWAEQEEFMVNLNVALRDKYGEDLDSFGSQKLGSLLTAFFKKHNHEKLKDVSHLEHGHDDLETDEERYPDPRWLFSQKMIPSLEIEFVIFIEFVIHRICYFFFHRICYFHNLLAHTQARVFGHSQRSADGKIWGGFVMCGMPQSDACDL